jgi:type VI secretion system protein ImpA
MGRQIDIDALMVPIPGENPAGEDLRYTQVYEAIKEARRSEEGLAMGDWQREVKTADWDNVITLAIEALSNRTKDLQIAAWLTEALTIVEGFYGLGSGLRIMAGFLEKFWDTAYPRIEDGDLEYRVSPFEFLNDKVTICIRQVPLTDTRTTPGYSWFKWQESRDVGSEADTKNRYGDFDDQKKQRRDEKIAEGKLTAEAFDAAVAQSSASFCQALAENVALCQQRFIALDKVVDEKFSREAPKISDLGQTIDECLRLVKKIYPDLKTPTATPEPLPSAEICEEPVKPKPIEPGLSPVSTVERPVLLGEKIMETPSRTLPPVLNDAEAEELSLWNESLMILESGRFKEALDVLLVASHHAPSERRRNRFRLHMVQLCLKAGRSDVARPIIEDLNALIDELHLERWESPLWIAEVLEAYYLCLRGDDSSDDDAAKTGELFKRICGLDATKAIAYRK